MIPRDRVELHSRDGRNRTHVRWFGISSLTTRRRPCASGISIDAPDWRHCLTKQIPLRYHPKLSHGCIHLHFTQLVTRSCRPDLVLVS